MKIIIRNINEEIKAHRSWYLFEGILFLVMGLLAILLPNVTVIAMTLLLGAILFLGGLAQTITFFRYPQRWWKLFSGLVFLIGGVIVAFMPMAGLLTLTVLIGSVLLLEGLFEIVFSLAFKPFPGWRWMMFSGVIALAFALFVLIGFPAATMLFLAIAVGLNMGTYGMSLLLLVFAGDKKGE